MDCKHELPHLMGTADGIVCRACGKLFKSFADIPVEDAATVEETPTEAKAEAKKPAKTSRKKKGEA